MGHKSTKRQPIYSLHNVTVSTAVKKYSSEQYQATPAFRMGKRRSTVCNNITLYSQEKTKQNKSDENKDEVLLYLAFVLLAADNAPV